MTPWLYDVMMLLAVEVGDISVVVEINDERVELRLCGVLYMILDLY
jgi:hypothetical protein